MSLLTIIKGDRSARQAQLDAMRARAATANQAIDTAVAAILKTVKAEGLSAVERYSQEFDHKAPYEISKSQMDDAYAR